ncbi:MAG: alkaline phosphatase family protein [Armatimonadota bacterium]
MPHSMTCIAPTVAAVLSLRPPHDATGEPIDSIVTDLEGTERLAIIAPDALGQHQLERFADEMPFLTSLCDRRHLVLQSVMPSVTCVNFATMITGCELDCHGINARNLDFACETLFDVLEEAGQAGAGCGRPGYTGGELLGRVAQIDGTAALSDDAAVEEAVLRIAHEEGPVFIIAQIGGTDDHFHRFGPGSPRMVPKLRETDCRLERMVSELTEGGYAVMILSDHGQHDTGNPEYGGTHGTESDEDRLVPCTWLGG